MHTCVCVHADVSTTHGRHTASCFRPGDSVPVFNVCAVFDDCFILNFEFFDLRPDFNLGGLLTLHDTFCSTNILRIGVSAERFGRQRRNVR